MNKEYKKLYSFKEMQELKSIIASFRKKNRTEFEMKILKEFMEKYSNNVFAKLEYAKLLFETSQYNEAVYYFKKIYNDIDYFTDNERDFIIISLAQCYYILGQYESALKVIDNNINDINSIFYLNKLQGLFEVIKYKLGIITNEEFNSMNISYSYRQQIDYNESLAIEHIKTHCNEIKTKENHSLFSDGIDIEKLFYEIKMDLTNAKINYQSGLETIYQYYYSNIGLCDNIVQDYLKVVVVKDTYNILTMYPTKKENNIINNLPLSLENVKTKSMVDRFNKKFNYIK